MSSYAKMKVQELRDACAARSLDETGVKAVLVERLEAADAAAAEAPAAEHAAAPTHAAVPSPAAPAPVEAHGAAAPAAATEAPAKHLSVEESKVARAARFGLPVRCPKINSHACRSRRPSARRWPPRWRR